MEVYCQLYVAVDLEYLTFESFETIKIQIDKISNKLNALNRSLIKRLNASTFQQKNDRNRI